MQNERMGPGHQKPKPLPSLQDCAYMLGIVKNSQMYT